MQLKRTWDDYLGLVRALQLPLMCFAYALNLVNCLQCKNMPGAGLKQEKGCTTMSQRGGQRRFLGKEKRMNLGFWPHFLQYWCSSATEMISHMDALSANNSGACAPSFDDASWVPRVPELMVWYQSAN